MSTHKTSGDHDGRYYTESEIDEKLAGKSNTSETGYTLSVDGRTISLKNKSGSVLSNITTQDTNTTYSAGTGLNLSGTTFSLKSIMSHLHTANTVSGKCSINGNTAKSFSFNLSIQSGFQVLAIFAIHINGVTGCCIQSYSLSGSTVTVWVNNFESNTKSSFTLTAEYVLIRIS